MKKIFTIILSLILSIFSYALDVYVEKVSDGDSFVAKYNGKKILLECGLFQKVS